MSSTAAKGSGAALWVTCGEISTLKASCFHNAYTLYKSVVSLKFLEEGHVVLSFPAVISCVNCVGPHNCKPSRHVYYCFLN